MAWFEASIRLALDQAGREGAGALLQRLPELLFVECLWLFAQELAALRDRAVGRALVRIHAEPAPTGPWRPWPGRRPCRARCWPSG